MPVTNNPLSPTVTTTNNNNNTVTPPRTDTAGPAAGRPTDAAATTFISASSTYTHQRRTMNKPNTFEEDKKATSYSNASYKHSTDTRSKALKEHLLAVHAGITQVCNDFNIQCNSDDMSWLLEHKGHFQKYIHPNTPQYKEVVQAKKYANQDIDDVKRSLLEKQHTLLGEHSPRWSGRVMKDSYRDVCEVALVQFWNFLAITGDYMSMLLLLPHPPAACPSISLDSLRSCILHHFHYPNQHLYKYWDSREDSERVKDRHGVPMKTQGGKYSPHGHGNLCSALKILHGRFAKMQNNMYCSQCKTCLSLFKTALSNHRNHGVPEYPSTIDPCPSHTGEGPNRFCPYGNPMVTDSIKQLYTYIEKTCSKRKYQCVPAAPILPCDMLKLHSLMYSQGYPLETLARYTMILGAIHSASRFDEYSDIKCRDFNCVSHLFEIRSNRIVSIAQEVFGKRDERWYTYRIAFADSVPKLCYLRHLLIYVHCANLSKDDDCYLYPQQQHLSQLDSSVENCFKEDNVHYAEILKWMNDHLGSPGATINNNVKPHSPRSSFYLWWILAGGLVVLAQRNARHVGPEMAMKYSQDAFIKKDLIMRDPYLRASNPVPPAYDRLMTDRGHQIHRIHQMSQTANTTLKTLKEVAELYVTHTLLVDSDSPHYRNPSYLLERSYQTASLQNNPYQKLLGLVSSLPPNHAVPMKKAVTEMFNEMHRYYWDKFQKELSGSRTAPQHQFQTQTTVPPEVVHHPPSNNMYILTRVDNNPKYVFNSNTNRLSKSQVARYMYDIVKDVINITPPSDDTTNFDRWNKGRFEVDVFKKGSTLKSFWTKRGMLPFAECIIQHYDLDFDRFWESKSASFQRNSAYKCTCHSPATPPSPSTSV